MLATVATVAARPAALAAPAPRRARRPRWSSPAALIAAIRDALTHTDPIDSLLTVASAEQTAEFVTMSLLSRAIDGDEWARDILARRGR